LASGWDPIWEEIFSTRTWGKYPPEDLVRFIARNYYGAQDRSLIRVLDLGCGPGACSWYLAREGFSTYGIDGSPTAIDQVRKRLAQEQLHGEFHVGDLVRLPWPDDSFDAAIDIESVTSNTFHVSRQIVAEVWRVLKPNGLLFSISFKAGSWGDGTGRRIEEHTREGITEGPCAGMGVIRFSPEEEIRELHSEFQDLSLEYDIRSVDQMTHIVAQWVITCRKPSSA